MELVKGRLAQVPVNLLLQLILRLTASLEFLFLSCYNSILTNMFIRMMGIPSTNIKNRILARVAYSRLSQGINRSS